MAPTTEPTGRPHNGAGPQSGYVPGYVPVVVGRAVLEEMRSFRARSLNVDLRIERAMVSAATELCLEDGGLRETLRESANAALCNPTTSAAVVCRDRGHTAPVLIRRSVKRGIRTWALQWNLQGADEVVNNVLVSSAISLVLAAENLHVRWIQMIAATVGNEVVDGFNNGHDRSR